MADSQNDRLGAAKIYTRTGDEGKTSLVGGARVSKSELRLEAYGTVDEFNSALGLALALFANENGEPHARARITEWGEAMQLRLFDLGCQLACEDAATRARLPNLGDDEILGLEKQMDEMSAELAPLRNFVLPTGAPSAAAAHVARAICRRAERLCVRFEIENPGSVDASLLHYLNRASDWAFVLARYMNRATSTPETLWRGRSK